MSSSYRPSDIVFLEAKRSILGNLSPNKAVALGSHVLRGLIDSLPPGFLDSYPIEQMIIGHAIGAGVGQNLPRQIVKALKMAPPESAFLINELCGSSLEAVLSARQGLLSEGYTRVIAGGIECPSSAPYLISREELIQKQDQTLGEVEPLLKQASIQDALWCAVHDEHTIVHGEATTAKWVQKMKKDPKSIKEKIDIYACQSHQRALEAQQKGIFDEEIILLPGTPERDTLPHKLELQKLQKRQGTGYTPEGQYLTSHNSPPLADCAAFTLMSTYSGSLEMGMKPMARILDYARIGIPEEDYLLAPQLAVKKLLNKTKMSINDFDYLELNPAFGSQMLFYEEELGADMNKVNAYGDCIAMGHPIGAAGVRLLTTLLHTLVRENKTLGLEAICLGGGNGIALAIERI